MIWYIIDEIIVNDRFWLYLLAGGTSHSPTNNNDSIMGLRA